MQDFISFTVISNYVDWTVFVAFSLLKYIEFEMYFCKAKI